MALDGTGTKGFDGRPAVADLPGLRGACVDILTRLGVDLAAPGLAATPDRMAKFWAEFIQGAAPFELTTFPADGMDEMVIQTGIPFYSMCEHHLLPFFGTAAVAYLPKDNILGLSKLTRVVQYHARGLQNQERITHDTARSLDLALDANGVAVLLRARHMCMEMRGVRTSDTHTTTVFLTGRFRDDARTRAEFMDIASRP